MTAAAGIRERLGVDLGAMTNGREGPSPGRAQLAPGSVLLGTVALEPNRWGAISPDRAPHLHTGDWLARAEDVGFDGIELWEHHAMLAAEEEVEALLASPLPVSVLSSYASFEEPDDAARSAVAGWAARLRCAAVKYNVGNDADRAGDYAARAARMADALPTGTRLICECHAGTAAEDPTVAAKILSEAGPPDRSQALVHLGDEPDYVDSMFDALGDRIHHVHVNFLRQGAPVLAEIADDVRARVERLRGKGFAGSYTIEFVNGVGSEKDRPPEMLEAAVRDLALLREVLA